MSEKGKRETGQGVDHFGGKRGWERAQILKKGVLLFAGSSFAGGGEQVGSHVYYCEEKRE